MRRDFGSKFWRLMECVAPLYVIAFFLTTGGYTIARLIWR